MSQILNKHKPRIWGSSIVTFSNSDDVSITDILYNILRNSMWSYCITEVMMHELLDSLALFLGQDIILGCMRVVG